MDIAFASDLVGALSDASIKYVGEGMIRGGSGLALFQKLLVPYNGVTGDSKKKLLLSVTKPLTCNDLDSLHVGLAKWDSARESYTFTSGKTLEDDQLESILEGMYKGIEVVEKAVQSLRDNWDILTPDDNLTFDDVHKLVHKLALRGYQNTLNNPKKPKEPKAVPKADANPSVNAIREVITPINRGENRVVHDCIEWQLGECKYGDKCKYKHDPSTKGKGHVNGLTGRLAAMAAMPCHAFI